MTTRRVAATLRVSLIGGGTDMPEYVRDGRVGRCVILKTKLEVGAIVQESAVTPMHRNASTTLDPRVDTALTSCIVDAVGFLPERDTYITMTEDAPTRGTGLGSSSAWTRALSEGLGCPDPTPHFTFDVERNSGSACGYQDHVAASLEHGLWNVSFFEGARGGWAYDLRELQCHWLRDCVSLVYLGGERRDSNSILIRQSLGIKERIPMLERMTRLAAEAEATLTGSDSKSGPKKIISMVKEAWGIKRSYAPGVSNPRIDELIKHCEDSGCGAKLLGAGGSGYLCVFHEPGRFPLSLLDKFNLEMVNGWL